LPALSEVGRHVGQADQVFLVAVVKGVKQARSVAVARPRTESGRRQLLVERRDVAQFDAALVVGVVLGTVGRRDNSTLGVQDEGERPGADLALRQVAGKAVERDVDRDHAANAGLVRKRLGDSEPNQAEGGEDVGVGDAQPAQAHRVAVPATGTRIVESGRRRSPQLFALGVEVGVGVDQPALVVGQDMARGECRSLGREFVEHALIGVHAPALAERTIAQPDIGTDDRVAVQHHALKIRDRDIAVVEVGRLVAEGGRRAHQRLDRIYVVLDVFDGIGAEPLDQAGGAFASNSIVGEVCDGDDGHEDRHRQNDERRQDARPQPWLVPEKQRHPPATSESGMVLQRRFGVHETGAGSTPVGA